MGSVAVGAAEKEKVKLKIRVPEMMGITGNMERGHKYDVSREDSWREPDRSGSGGPEGPNDAPPGDDRSLSWASHFGE